MTFQQWEWITEEQFSSQDVAELNLMAAVGLPGSEDLNVVTLLRKLDGWAKLVAVGTSNAMKCFHNREYRGVTPCRFRMMALVTVVQRNLGVHYKLPFSEGEYDASDSRDLFLHGPLTGHGGTCATMPILYVAIGRRLGYPLKLVEAKQHLFCRWDEPNGSRFNIEATSPGFRDPPDEYYLERPQPLTVADLATGRYLKNLNARQEAALFLGERGNCALDNLDVSTALDAFDIAARLDSAKKSHANGVAVGLMVARILASRGNLERSDNFLQVSLPTPTEPWQHLALPAARSHIERVLRNRERRVREPPTT